MELKETVTAILTLAKVILDIQERQFIKLRASVQSKDLIIADMNLRADVGLHIGTTKYASQWLRNLQDVDIDCN